MEILTDCPSISDFDCFARFLEWANKHLINYDWCNQYIPWLQDGKPVRDYQDSSKLYNHWFERYQKFIGYPATFLDVLTISIKHRMINCFFTQTKEKCLWKPKFTDELFTAFFAFENSIGLAEFMQIFPKDEANAQFTKSLNYVLPNSTHIRLFASFWTTLSNTSKQLFYQLILPMNLEDAKVCSKKYFLASIHGDKLTED